MKTLIAFCGKLGSGKGYHMMKMVEELKTTGNSIYMVSFADPIKQILRNSFGLEKTGKLDVKLPVITELYVKHQVIDSLYTLIKELDYEKFRISEHDLKAYIARNYEKYETEFFGHVESCIYGLYEGVNSNYGYHFRRLGQMLGTELGRHLIDSIWVDIAFHKIKKTFKDDLADYATIDDCRFLNEYEMINNFKNVTAFDSKIYGIVTSDETRAKRRNMTMEELLAQDQHGSEQEIDSIIEKLDKEFLIHND